MALTNLLKRRRHAILVAGDAAEGRKALKETLAGQHAEVFEVQSGGQALKIVGRRRLDLVILAVTSDVSGTGILRRIRKLDQGVPVIVVTSRGSVETVRAAMELGAFDYLTRPLDTREMRQVIDEALGSRTA